MNPGNCPISHSGKLGIRRDHTRHRIEMKFRVMGGLQEIVLRFEFHQNRLSGFGAVGTGDRHLPFLIDLATGLCKIIISQQIKEVIAN